MSFEDWEAVFRAPGTLNAYATADLRLQKRAAFDASVQRIQQHNSNSASYRLGVNQFSDLTESEFRALGSCGSCWAFSATGAIEGAYAIATGELRSLSEEQLVECTRAYGNDDCGGGDFVGAFEYVKNNSGIDSEHDYPYTAGDGFGGNACWGAASGRRVAAIDGYRAIAKNSTAALLAALQREPVSVAVDSTVWQSYKSGTIASGCGTALDHAVLLVGATDEYLVVKNSWGLADLCEANCMSLFGMRCCGDAPNPPILGNCTCGAPASCPSCAPH
ncbi:transferase [Aureococcus anophagefferens]|nr:transferase [Aureococcus anophagefferens]